MSNNSLNPEVMNNIKNMVDSGNISGAISQISPEMIENFSKILSSNSNSDGSYNDNSSNSKNSNNFNNSKINNNSNNHNSSSTFNNSNNSNNSNDFGNIDINTILKMKSVIEKINNKNDPRSNLLYSLKPYLREAKQEKLDQYVNLLNVSKIADILKTDKKDDKNA